MPVSYVEEIAVPYYMEKGYVVNQGIAFQIPKKRTGKRVAGWSDIDILALAPGEVLIVQCKGGIADKEDAIDVAEKLKFAKEFLENSEHYRPWLQGSVIKKVLIVDWCTPKYTKILQGRGVEVVYLEDIMREILATLSTKKSFKEYNVVFRTLRALVEWGLIKEEVYQTQSS